MRISGGIAISALIFTLACVDVHAQKSADKWYFQSLHLSNLTGGSAN